MNNEISVNVEAINTIVNHVASDVYTEYNNFSNLLTLYALIPNIDNAGVKEAFEKISESKYEGSLPTHEEGLSKLCTSKFIKLYKIGSALQNLEEGLKNNYSDFDENTKLKLETAQNDENIKSKLEIISNMHKLTIKRFTSIYSINETFKFIVDDYAQRYPELKKVITEYVANLKKDNFDLTEANAFLRMQSNIED